MRPKVYWSLVAALACFRCTSGGHAPGGSEDASIDAAVDAAIVDAGPIGCDCFAHGKWAIDNVSPCFITTAGITTSAVSTVLIDNQPQCPPDPTTKPQQPWSEDELTTDCAGHFRLCYTLKASSTGCVLAKSCAEGDYATPNVAEMWPALDSWIITTLAEEQCANDFVDGGGHGEMSVEGTAANGCHVDRTFAKITYCPVSCAPHCPGCTSGGDGSF